VSRSFRLAKEEHWKYSDMMKHTMYKRLFELKTSDRQVIQTAGKSGLPLLLDFGLLETFPH
jgi:hypothetical protein